MKNSYKIIILILVFTLVFSGCDTPKDTSLATILNSGYFIVGYDPDNYHTFEGYGLAINIIKTAAERMDVQAPIQPVEIEEWQKSLDEGDIEIMLCEKTDSDLQTVNLFYDSIVFIKKQSTEIATVGIIDSTACISEKNKISSDLSYKYVYYSDADLLLSDMTDGIIDSAILSEYNAMVYENIGDCTVENLNYNPVTFIVSKNNQTFYDEINRVLNQMVEDGTIGRLKQEYINSLK